MQTIATLTMNPCVDVSSTVDRIVAERKLRCRPPRYEPGGGGLNVSRAIGKLGGDSTAIYFAGGPTGGLLQELLDREGLVHRPLAMDGWTRQTYMVTDEATRQMYRFLMPGPELKEAEWQRSLAEIAALKPKPAYLIASGSLPPGTPEDFFAKLAGTAKTVGTRLVVDTSGPALHAAVRAGVYLLKPNVRELGELAGQEIQGEEELEHVAKRLIQDQHAEVVVVSLGAGGATLVTAESCERIRSPAVPIRSKVGAGDCMVAGIVLALTRGQSIGQAIRFGVAAGAAAVMTPGTELCRREDAERLFERMNIETG